VYIPPKPDNLPDWKGQSWGTWTPCMLGGDYHYSELDDDHPGTIWLPRQDQLQEMVFGEFYKLGGEERPSGIDEMLGAFQDFCFVNKCPLEWPWNEPNLSMEQLWLAFVMHERFGKRWNTEKGEWVK